MVLSRYLKEHHDLFEKEFAYVKLDGRLDRGAAVIERLRPNREGGIPWMVVLDEDGGPLITSDSSNGNIGYPSDAESIAHFEKMFAPGPGT